MNVESGGITALMPSLLDDHTRSDRFHISEHIESICA